MRSLGLAVIAAGMLAALACRSESFLGMGGQNQDQNQNSLGPNAGCYVCHMTFVKEPLTVTHLAKKITCVKCHGTSSAHANDEDIGATPPDKIIKRERVNAYCRSCHGKRKHKATPEALVARWLEHRGNKPTTRPANPAAVCTDCHGKHKIGA